MATERSLVLVAGSGRSGTSLCAGLLQRLGFHVPQPEVSADDTNPRGFAESQWVVDFHASLLKRARVQVADARPAAWAQAAEVAFDPSVQRTLRTWLNAQFREADHIVVKDPRLSWFVPLWRRCALDAGVSPGFVTMLRHPAAVIDSKQRWYGGWQGDVGRAAGWINQTLFTERATRDSARVFVHYDDLLEDWTQAVARIGDRLDLAVVRDAPVASMRRAHDFVDVSLSRSRADWDGVKIPPFVRAQADAVWELVSELAADAARNGGPPLGVRLDATRAAYIVLYEEAEAVARSSIEASRGRAGIATDAPAARLIRRIPTRWRHKIPVDWRRRILRILAG